jgi:hypothetical protein
MTRKGLSISAFLGGALLALPLSASRADEPMTANQAQLAAQDARDQAEHFRQLGGVGYKTGLVQRADADAARYDAKALELAPTPTVTQQLLDEERHEKLEAHYRAVGGVAYKTGMEQRGEAQARMQELAAPEQTPNPSCLPTKPIVDAACKNAQ